MSPEKFIKKELSQFNIQASRPWSRTAADCANEIAIIFISGDVG